MIEHRLAYDLDDHPYDVFVAEPTGPGPHPVVIICHAFSGRQRFEEDKARALAQLGYVGAAIDLYGVGQRGADRAQSQALMGALVQDPETLRRRLRRAFDEVTALPAVDATRAAGIGFCFGGLCAILMARMGLPLAGVVSFHGLLKVGASLGHEVTGRILVLHGQDDPMVPPEDVAAFAAEMQRVHADWQLHAYPHTMHAFTNPAANDPGFGTVYNPVADRRSWAEMRAFLAEVWAPDD